MSCSDKELETPEKIGKPWVTAQGFEIRVTPQSLEIAIAQLERALEGGESRLDHAQDQTDPWLTWPVRANHPARLLDVLPFVMCHE